MADIIGPGDKKPKGTAFTNISDIVRANRQNRLGSTVSSGVQRTVGQGQQDLSGIRQQFQQQSQAGALGGQQDKEYVQQTIQGAGQTPQSQADIDRFSKLRSGQYQGPQGLGNQEQLQARQADLQGIARASANQYGQRGLLQRFVGQPDYTQGQQRLDTLLLGQTGASGLRQARQAAGQFGRELSDAERQARAEAQGLTQQARAFGQDVTGQLGTAQTGLQESLKTRAEQATLQSQAARQALQALLSKPTTQTTPAGEFSTMPVGGSTSRPRITQEQYNALKDLLPAELAGRNIYGPEFFTSSPEQVIGQEGALAATIPGIAKDVDKQRSIALAKLSGQVPTDFTEETQIGGYDPLKFLDRSNLDKILQQSESQYKEAAPYASLMDRDTNLANIQYLGSQYRPYATQQASAISDLASKIQDPSQAGAYRRLAEQLGAWGGGRGYLFGGDEQKYFKDLYNQVLGKSQALESAYPGGAEAIRQSSGVPLIERLKSLISG